MRKLLLIAVLGSLIPGLYGLTGTGVSANITLDTVMPTLDLLSPSGGEEWYVGDTRLIMWTAFDTHPASLPVSLFYSLDGGSHWTAIGSTSANDGTESWLLPFTQSYGGKVRITFADTFGHVAQDMTSGVFSITYAPPLDPQNMGIGIINGYDVSLDWDPVSQTIYGTPVVPDGYLVFMANSPLSEDDYSFLWYVTGSTNFIHGNAARFADKGFYYVLAYKDFSGRLIPLLNSSLAAGQRLTLADIRREIAVDLGGGE